MPLRLDLLCFLFGAVAWRWLLGAGAIPAVIVLVLRRKVEETPRFAAEMNDQKEIKEIKEKFGIDEKAETSPTDDSGDYITPNYKKRGVFVFTSWFLNDLIFYGIGIYTASLLLELGYSSHAGSLTLTLILYLIGVVGTIAFVFTADLVGRKKWQAYTFLAQGVSLFVLGIYFVVVKSAPPLLLLFPMFAIFYFANAGGTGETTGIFVSELFPTRIRTTALGAGTAISRVGAIISAVVFPITLKLYGILPMEMLLFAVGLAGFLITMFIGEETKNLSLEKLSS